MAKIKIDKNGIGDIRQLTKNPDNPYVRDEEQITNLINSFEEKKESGEVRLNNYSIRCYSDGVIKGGNSRWDAGMESGNYFLHIDIDPKSSTEASKKEKVKDLLDDNIKRKDKWEDRVLCYKLWEDAEQEERDIEKIQEQMEIFESKLRNKHPLLESHDIVGIVQEYVEITNRDVKLEDNNTLRYYGLVDDNKTYKIRLLIAAQNSDSAGVTGKGLGTNTHNQPIYT